MPRTMRNYTSKREWSDVLRDAETAAKQKIVAETQALLKYLELRGLTEEQAVVVMQFTIRSLTEEDDA